MRFILTLCIAWGAHFLSDGKSIDKIEPVPAPEPTAQPTALVFSNVQSNSMTLSWTAAAPAPIGYIVLRATVFPPADAPADGTSYTVGDIIGTSTVAYIGPGTTFNELTLSSATG